MHRIHPTYQPWPDEVRTAHLIGVGGVGMNALAQILSAGGIRVTGSDRLFDQQPDLPVFEQLKALGIELHKQDGGAINPDTSVVVVSTAIEDDNPDWTAAQQSAIPICHRADVLATWIGDAPCIAVAGTSGKTTVTAMVGWLLTEMGMQPNVVNGGNLLDWQSATAPGNVRLTGSPWWVVEVDESDRSLLAFQPDWAILTTITADHFPLSETTDLFVAFADQVRQGLIIDTAVAHTLEANAFVRCPLRPVDTQALAEVLPLQVPGRHNQQNAALALALCDQLNFDREKALEALSRFRGVERRLQRITPEPAGAEIVHVFDDYAHNPEKIRAAWEAVAATAPGIHAVWRPHGFAPLAAMADDLQAVLREVMRSSDHFYVLPVYYAGGTTTRSLTAETWAEQGQTAGLSITHVPDYDVLESLLLAAVQPGDAVLVMGARDPELPRFAQRLANQLH